MQSNIEYIQYVAVKHFKPITANLSLKCRVPSLVETRNVCIVLYQVYLNMSISQASGVFKMNRTASYHAKRQIRDLCLTEPPFREKVLALLQEITDDNKAVQRLYNLMTIKEE